MRHERLYLRDIAEAAADMAEFLEGLDLDDFVASKVVHSAVLQKLIVIGESANRVSPDLQARHAEIPWSDIIGLRNIVAHAYFSVVWSRIWRTATKDVPALAHAIARILAEFDDLS
jgi:uncharacterized protein with HEPN domain